MALLLKRGYWFFVHSKNTFMKRFCIAFLFSLFGLMAFSQTATSDVVFGKAVYKVQATVKKIDGKFMIVPDQFKDFHYIPVVLPEEYKINGLKVTFDGDLGEVEGNETALNIKKIWVDYALKEKYHLVHKMYDLN